ncbi:MAG: hypothetical protein R6W72_13525 [Desulfurivibrionaceae bacterium]
MMRSKKTPYETAAQHHPVFDFLPSGKQAPGAELQDQDRDICSYLYFFKPFQFHNISENSRLESHERRCDSINKELKHSEQKFINHFGFHLILKAGEI